MTISNIAGDALHCRRIKDVAGDELDVGLLVQTGRTQGRRGAKVKDPHPIVRAETLDQMGADKARPACNEDGRRAAELGSRHAHATAKRPRWDVTFGLTCEKDCADRCRPHPGLRLAWPGPPGLGVGGRGTVRSWFDRCRFGRRAATGGLPAGVGVVVGVGRRARRGTAAGGAGVRAAPPAASTGSAAAVPLRPRLARRRVARTPCRAGEPAYPARLFWTAGAGCRPAGESAAAGCGLEPVNRSPARWTVP